MNNQVTVRYNAIPLCSAGFVTWLVFFILKLCNVLPVEFTWFWVFFPLWLPIAISSVILIIFLFLYWIINRG